MGFLRLVLNIPYTNLYNASSSNGKLFIDALNSLIATGGSSQSLVDLEFNNGVDAITQYWGNQDFGSCFSTWITNCQIATNVHYMYQGPDVNPNGSNCTSYILPTC